MRINTNISAMNTYGRLTSANSAKSSSLAKLSSGLRINKAGDDAAGLAISEKMKGQVGGLKQAIRNAQDGVSLIQTAEGALNETHSILGRMRDLAVQGANGTLSQDDRAEINKEFDALKEEITRISKTTEFNTKKLLNTNNQEFTFQIGANGGQTMSVKIDKMDAESLSLVDSALAGDAASTEVAGAKVVLDKKAELTAATDAKAAFTRTATTAMETAVTTAKQNIAKDDYANQYATIDDADDLSSVDKAAITAATGIDLDSVTTGTALKAALGAPADEAGRTALETAVTTTEKTLADAKAADEKALAPLNKAVEDATDAVAVAEETVLDSVGRQNASDAIKAIDEAIKQVSSQRSDLGAAQNRLGHTVNNLTTTQENLAEANSRIRDVDMAEEMMEFTKNNILSQAATSMLAQANSMPNSVLTLLQ